MKILITTFLFTLMTALSFSQKRDEGKMKIILVNSSKMNFQKDSCFLYIYLEDSVLEKINLTQHFGHKQDDNPTFDLWIKDGNYTALIANMNLHPIIITDIKVKKGALCYFPIDYKELNSENTSDTKALIKAHSKLLKKYFKD